jgi:hypothetical protein
MSTDTWINVVSMGREPVAGMTSQAPSRRTTGAPNAGAWVATARSSLLTPVCRQRRDADGHDADVSCRLACDRAML